MGVQWGWGSVDRTAQQVIFAVSKIQVKVLLRKVHIHVGKLGMEGMTLPSMCFANSSVGSKEVAYFYISQL